jgi:opine dehydrogenase
MRIAVLGGGNGSFAAAADMALAGHEVRLWRRDPAAVADHLAAGGSIAVRDAAGRRVAKPALVTSDLAEAVQGAELVLVPLPATAQHDLAPRLAPHLAPGQVVYLPPGTLGTALFAQHAHHAGVRDVAFAETGTLPWLVRKRGPYEIAITTRAVRLPTGVFPERLAPHALAVTGAAFPGAIEPCGDALSAALLNGGPTIHAPLILMNAGAIDRFARGGPDFDIHNEGTQPAIRRVTDALDSERIALREALGYGPPHFPLAHHYAKEGELWMYPRFSHADLQDSNDWREKLDLTRHRYMTEDTLMGLPLLLSVARLAGTEMPLTAAFAAIGRAVSGLPFGRSLESVGLGGLDLPALRQVLHDGFA